MMQKQLTFPDWPLFWQRCLADYLQSVYERSHSEESLKSYTAVLRQFFSTSLNGGLPKPPDHYSRADVEWFIHRPLCNGKEAAIGTRNIRLKAVKSLYRFASEYTIPGPDGPQRLLSRVPPTLGIKRAKMAEPKPKAMSLDELERLFAVIDSSTVIGARDLAVFTFYLYSTRRREEICRLRWKDIQEGTIVDEDGNTRLGYQYSFFDKGSAGAIKTLELPGPCYVALEKYLVISGRLTTIKPEDPLFIAHGPANGGGKHHGPNQPMDSDTIAANLKRYARLAGLDTKRVSIHSFRHSGIQLRLATGQEMLAVMKISQHKSLDVFYGYARRLMGVADNHAKRLEDKLSRLGVK